MISRRSGFIGISLILMFLLSTVSAATPYHLFGTESVDMDGGDFVNGPPPLTGPSARDGSRAVVLQRMIGAAPTIDGLYNAAGEWSEASIVHAGFNGNTVEVYLMADGERLYVLVDIVSDTDLDLDDAPVDGLEYIGMIFDGDNSGGITYQSGAAGSQPISQGGQNPDFGFIYWGDGSYWNYSVTRGAGNSITFATTTPSNTIMVASFSTTPNSGTPHRVLEFMIPYDGDDDELGCSIGMPFTKRFNLLALENSSGNAIRIGEWPAGLTNLATNFDTLTLPQKYPHIADVIDPQENDVFQFGQDVRFEMVATDNNLSTLQRTLYLEGQPAIDMGGLDFIVKNDIPIGSYNVTFRIDDDEGFSDTWEVGKIKVLEAAVSPEIENTTPTGESVTINEGETQLFSVEWNDLNLDQANESVSIDWSIEGDDVNPAWISKVTRFGWSTHLTSNLTFKSNHIGDFSAGTYAVQLILEDSYFNTHYSVIRSWSLKVTNVNRVPDIFTTSPETTDTIVLQETESREFIIEKNDPDLDTLTVKWYVDGAEQTTARDMDNFTFNANAPDYDLAGNHTVKVVVSDGDMSDEAQWAVRVTNVNREPLITSYSPDDLTIAIDEGDEIEFTYLANDPDDDPLSYMWYVNEREKAQGSGNTAFTFETTYLKADGYDSSDSPYHIKLEVMDSGLLSRAVEWVITVDNVNRAPVPIIDRPMDEDTFKVNEKVLFKTTSSMDPDGETITYSWDFGDRRTASGPDVDHFYKESGRYKVVLSVSDGELTATTSINITIVIAKLKIDSIGYEPSPAKEGDSVRILITITNNGEAAAENVLVVFYVGSGGSKIKITDKVIERIEAGETVKANATWVAKPGNQVLSGSIPPNDENYLIDGKSEETTSIQVEKKQTHVTKSIFEDPLFLGAILAIIIVVVLVVAVAARRKKAREEEEEEKAIRAIIEAKEEKKEYVPPVKEASVFDRTDFQFGGTVEAKEVPCTECGKETTNPSGLCNVCTYKRKKRETDKLMMECPVCGNEVAKDMFTCPYCHFNFSKMDKEEEEEEKHEPVGYVSDDACADCGVLFNDGMRVRGCPSCDARYHKRCAGRLGQCCECNAELISGPMVVFEAAGPAEAPTETKVGLEEAKVEEVEAEPAVVKEEEAAGPVVVKEEVTKGDLCPSCKEEIEPDWKVCPNCDAKLGGPPPTKKVEVKKKEERRPPPPKEEAKVEEPGPSTGLCPVCKEVIEPDWKVCPSCDTKLSGPPPTKKVEVKKEERRPPPPKEEVKVEKEEGPRPEDKEEGPTRCPSCGEGVEPGWKVCPACDKALVELRDEEDKRAKKRITWSKKAKDKINVEKGPGADKMPPTKGKEPVRTKPVDDVESMTKELDDLDGIISKAEKEGRNVKKAKSLATLASSFLKGKKMDKVRIYIDRSKKELEK